MSKLEPRIMEYLEKSGNTHIKELIRHFHSTLEIPEEKIDLRINKLVTQKKLAIDHGLVSKYQDVSIPDEIDEYFEKGPIKVVRKGKQIFIQSNWEKKEHIKFMETIKKNLPKLKDDILNKIKEIETMILDNFDSLDVLAYVTATNIMGDPETYTESSFKGKQLIPEIINNLILKNSSEKYKNKSNRDKIPNIDELLSDLYNKITWYVIYSSMVQEGLDDTEKEIYMIVMSKFLFVRGCAYPQHYKSIATELFSQINAKLKGNGFSIEEYYNTVEEIERQINYNYNEPRKKLHEEHQRFIDFSKQQKDQGTIVTEILEKYLQESEDRRKKLQPDFNLLSEIMLKGSFEITINDKMNQNVIDLLTLKFGFNEEWTTPFDMSEVPIKPIIKQDDKYYCFLYPYLIRNVISIIELSLTQKEKDEINYSDVKGKYFENKSLDLLNRLIPEGKVYPNLFFPGGEIDGIITKENKIILIEVKGKKKRIIAGHTNILSLIKDDFKSNINDAYNQAIKALKYIQDNDESVFKDENKEVALKIKRDQVKDIFVLNVCVDDFSEFATNLNLVKSWDDDLLKERIYPWIISIYDLIVISDLIKQSDHFFDYMQQRIKIGRTHEIKSCDELDFLGYFLEHGSLERDKDIEELQNPMIHGYSETIDRWYAFKAGEVVSAEKPVYNEVKDN